MWNNLFKPMDSLQRGLSAGWLRNAVIRNNLANIETPNYKASDVQFESLLKKAAQDNGGFTGYRTNEKHLVIGPPDISSITPHVYQRRDTSMRADGNNVDLESENVRLAQNSILYNTIMEKLNGEIRRLRMAINEGK